MQVGKINILDANAIKEFDDYIDKLKSNLRQISVDGTDKLVEYGHSKLQSEIERAKYDGDKTYDIYEKGVTLENGYTKELHASGPSIYFMEFGTGVYYNNDDTYGGIKPSGIVGIGEYGHGNGKRDWWVYQGEGGEVFRNNPKLKITHGNIANMFMWNTLTFLDIYVTIAFNRIKDGYDWKL